MPSKRRPQKQAEPLAPKTPGEKRTSSAAAQPPADERSVTASVGGQVRLLRKQLGVTARELASLAGLSVSTLSKVENGRISPSLAALKSLAEALNVPIGSLFAEFDERRDCSFVPSGKGMRIERRGTREGHEYSLLGPSLSGDISLEPYLITLKEGSKPYTGFRHPGVELIYMLSGRMAYRHGERAYPMKSGDTLLFDANSSHGPDRLDDTPCTYLSIIVSPRVS